MPEEEDAVFGVHTSRHPEKRIGASSEKAKRIVGDLKANESNTTEEPIELNRWLLLELLYGAAERVGVPVSLPHIDLELELRDSVKTGPDVGENIQKYSSLILQLIDQIISSPQYPDGLNFGDKHVLRIVISHIIESDKSVHASIHELDDARLKELFARYTKEEKKAIKPDEIVDSISRMAIEAYKNEQQERNNIDEIVNTIEGEDLYDQRVLEKVQEMLGRQGLGHLVGDTPQYLTGKKVENYREVIKKEKSPSQIVADKVRKDRIRRGLERSPRNTVLAAESTKVWDEYQKSATKSAESTKAWTEHQKKAADDKAKELDRTQRIRTAMDFYGQNLPALQEMFGSDFEFLYTDQLIERMHQMRLESGYYNNPQDESSPRFIDGLHDTGVLVDIESPEVCNLHAVAVRVAVIERLKSELLASRSKRRYKAFESSRVLDMEVVGSEIVATPSSKDRGYVCLFVGGGYSFGYWFDVNEKKLIGGRKELETIDGSPIHFGFVKHRSGDEKQLFLPLVSSIKPLTGCNVVFGFGQEMDEKTYNKPALLSKVRQLCDAIKKQRDVKLEMTFLAFHLLDVMEDLKRTDASLEYVHMLLSLIGESQRDVDTTLFQVFSSSQLQEKETIVNEDGQPQEVIVVARGSSVYEQVGKDMHKMEYICVKEAEVAAKNITLQTFTIYGGLARDIYGRDTKKYPRYRVVGDEFGRVWFYKLGADFESILEATPEQYRSLVEMFCAVETNNIGNEKGSK